MGIGISAIEYYLPHKVLTNEALAELYVDWSASKIYDKTGIKKRHIAAADECASDLAVAAAEKLFLSGAAEPKDIDFLLFATQSPDYLLPTTACLLQDRLGIPTSAGALDFNLGCSAFIYGLALAKGLISTGAAKNVLFLTAETYSKFIHDMDKSTRTLFGDGAAATLICRCGSDIGTFDFGTDGQGENKLIVKTSGVRFPYSEVGCTSKDIFEEEIGCDYLYMDGLGVFNFTIHSVPLSIEKALDSNSIKKEDIDLFVLHQANKFILDHLRKKINIPDHKFIIDIRDTGNTVSSTIPIALKRAEESGRLQKENKVLLSGFGVGFSWGSTVLTW